MKRITNYLPKCLLIVTIVLLFSACTKSEEEQEFLSRIAVLRNLPSLQEFSRADATKDNARMLSLINAVDSILNLDLETFNHGDTVFHFGLKEFSEDADLKAYIGQMKEVGDLALQEHKKTKTSPNYHSIAMEMSDTYLKMQDFSHLGAEAVAEEVGISTISNLLGPDVVIKINQLTPSTNYAQKLENKYFVLSKFFPEVVEYIVSAALYCNSDFEMPFSTEVPVSTFKYYPNAEECGMNYGRDHGNCVSDHRRDAACVLAGAIATGIKGGVVAGVISAFVGGFVVDNQFESCTRNALNAYNDCMR